MKKVLSLVAVVALVLTLVTAGIPAFAGTGAALACTDAEIEAGTTGDVTLTVSMTNNPGVMMLVVVPSVVDSTKTSKATGFTIKSAENVTPKLFDNVSKDANITLDANAGDVKANGNICTVTVTVANTVPAGTYYLKLFVADSSNYDEESVPFETGYGKITVKNPPVKVTGVSLDKTSATVAKNGKVTLTPTVAPSNADNKAVTWSTSNAAIATVNNGEVTGVALGKATITVKTTDGNYTATCAVEVVNCLHTKTTPVSAEASTCTKAGHAAYTKCDDCHAVVEGSDAPLPLAPHTAAEVVDAKYLKTAATCKDKAVYYKSCSECKVALNETFTSGDVDLTNHTGGTEIRDAKIATCKEQGYTGDVYCKGCGEKLESGEPIALTPHTVTTWTVTKEATTEENGEKTGECDVCHATFKVVTDKLAKEVKKENVEGAEIELQEGTEVPENVFFKAEEVKTPSGSQKAAADEAAAALKETLTAGLDDKAEVKTLGIFNLDMFLKEAAKDEQGEDADIDPTSYELKGAIKVTMKADVAAFGSYNKVMLVSLKGDTAEPVDFTINEEDGTITFVASSLNDYALIAGAGEKAEEDKPIAPVTGDVIPAVAAVLLAVSALGVFFLSKKVRA